MRELVPSTITVKRSESKWCVCKLCGKVDFVTRIHYTLPKFTEHGVQRHKRLWLCDECKQKLLDALRAQTFASTMKGGEQDERLQGF